VEDDEDGGAEVARQPAGEHFQGLDAARGSPDDDYLFSRRSALLTPR
jgi:hypothetical protein